MEYLFIFIGGLLLGRILLPLLESLLVFFQNFLTKTTNGWIEQMEKGERKQTFAIGFDTSSLVRSEEDVEDKKKRCTM